MKSLGPNPVAKILLSKEGQQIFPKVSGAMPARSDIDLPGPDWSDGQRNMVSSLAAAKEANRVLLTLSQNMAQTNDITAAMMDEGLACFCRRRSPLGIPAAYVLGFTAWTTWISFTPSTLTPNNTWIGLENYRFILASRNWGVAFRNILIYGLTFVSLTTVVGFLLAVLIDQRIRAENLFRSIFLYPLAVSFVVTGTVWRWLLNPELGIERLAHNLGLTLLLFHAELLDRLSVQLDYQPRYGYLRNRHRGNVASLWHSYGALSRRDSFRRAGTDQGCPNRWSAALADLFANHFARHRSGLRSSADRPAAKRNQDIRSGPDIDQRWARNSYLNAGDGCLRFHVSARFPGARLRRSCVDAANPRSRPGLVLFWKVYSLYRGWRLQMGRSDG